MLFTTLALAALSKVAYAQFRLSTVSNSSDVSGQFISGTHEGAALNYAFLGPVGEYFNYYSNNGTIVSVDDSSVYQFILGVDGSHVSISPFDPTAEFTFSGETLLLNGSSSGFWACHNVNDPYGYSTSTYELMYNTTAAPNAECRVVTLARVNDSGVSTSSAPVHPVSNNGTTLVTSTASGAGQYSNGTAIVTGTDLETVTCTERRCSQATASAGSETSAAGSVTGSATVASSTAASSNGTSTISTNSNAAAGLVAQPMVALGLLMGGAFALI